MANAKSSERALYEGMFLYPQSFGANLNAAADEVRSILERAGAELVVLTKWDERRLAYTIQGQKRGVYLLAYFYCPGVGISSIERDCNLSETVLRAMCIKADHMGEVELETVKKELTDIAIEVAAISNGEPTPDPQPNDTEPGAESNKAEVKKAEVKSDAEQSQKSSEEAVAANTEA